MHSVYMRFERVMGLWRVSFTSPSAPQGLRTFTFGDADKIEALAQRGGALACLADKQALEAGIRNKVGGIRLQLSDEQFARLLVPGS